MFRLIIALLATLPFFTAAAAKSAPITLRNVTIIDGTGSPPKAGQTILVRDGRIADIFATGTRPIPKQSQSFDLSGHTVLPGLIDAHVHLIPIKDREATLRAVLQSGVTSVREVAGDARISHALARRAARAEIESPAIYYSALLFGPSFLSDPRSRASARGLAPGTAPWSRAVTDESDLAQVISDALATGATGVKLYASLDADLIGAITREAHRQGLKVWSHSATFPGRPGDAVAGDVDSIIHARSLIAEGRLDVPDNYAEGTRVWIQAQDFAATKAEEPRFSALFARMVQKGTIFEPSLYGDDPAGGATGDWRDDMREWSCGITGAAHRAGVIIGAGTDTYAKSGALHREMARLVDCGLSELDAIRAATLNNAKAIGIEDTHGSIEPGKAADLVVIAGNPAANIDDTQKVALVVKAGRVFRNASTDREDSNARTQR